MTLTFMVQKEAENNSFFKVLAELNENVFYPLIMGGVTILTFFIETIP